MSSKCGVCPVSLLCLAGQLRIKLYCETCRCLELQCGPNRYGGVQQGTMIPCVKEDANGLRVVLSVCEACRVARKLGYYDRHCKNARRKRLYAPPRRSV
jgi:hypothetical protein